MLSHQQLSRLGCCLTQVVVLRAAIRGFHYIWPQDGEHEAVSQCLYDTANELAELGQSVDELRAAAARWGALTSLAGDAFERECDEVTARIDAWMSMDVAEGLSRQVHEHG